MLRNSLCSSAVLLAVLCPALAGQQVSPLGNPAGATTPSTAEKPAPNVEILSDTNGVDVNPYIRKIMADIYKNWVPLIPTEARPPQSKQGETLIRFKILPDGKIGAMWLDGSTHDDQINRSCWGSITSEGQFPPLPAGLETRPLILRIHFYVNKKPDSTTAPSAPQ